VNVRPPIATVAPRGSGSSLGATAIVTLPGPLPDVPLSEIQEVWFAAVHAHPDCAPTRTTCVPPSAPNVWASLSIVKTHGAAPCAISSRWSFTTSCPRRGWTAAFVAIVNGIVASPWPDAPAVNAIQSTSLRTVHWHSRLTAILSAPVAPEASTDRGSAVTFNEQRLSDDGAVTLTFDDDPQAATNSSQTHQRQDADVRRRPAGRHEQ
jgi:hypothetical protein